MNWVDLFLGLVILIAIIIGWRKGFILESLDLLTWVSSLVLAYMFYGNLASWLDRFFDLNVWLQPVSFIITAIVARILVGLIVRLLVRLIPDSLNDNFLNRILGIIPGAISGW